MTSWWEKIHFPRGCRKLVIIHNSIYMTSITCNLKVLSKSYFENQKLVSLIKIKKDRNCGRKRKDCSLNLAETKEIPLNC